MAAERIAPDAVLDSTNYTTLDLADIDEDPDSPDASYGTWDGNGNTSCRVSFATPSTGVPTTGAGLQNFRVLIRRTGAASLGWSLQLWENGAQVSVLATGTLAVASAVVEGTWDASSLGTSDGSLVECRLQQTGGGTGGGRQGIEVGAVEWNADTSVVARNASSAGAASAATGTGGATTVVAVASAATANAATGTGAATVPIEASSAATASAATGTGTAGAPVELAPIAQYWIDEASSGQTPTQVLDSEADPEHLTIQYSGSVPSYTADGEGRGLDFPTADADAAGAFSAALSGGNKIFDALDGATQATLIVKAEIDSTLSGGTQTELLTCFGIFQFDGENDVLGFWYNGLVPCFIADATGPAGWPDDYVEHRYNNVTAGMHVFAIVYDSTQGTAVNRLRLYMDGSLLTSFDPVTTADLNQQLDIPTATAHHLSLGGWKDFALVGGGWHGAIKYAAAYDVALTATEVGDISTTLAANDDPAGGARDATSAGVAAAATGAGTATSVVEAASAATAPAATGAGTAATLVQASSAGTCSAGTGNATASAVIAASSSVSASAPTGAATATAPIAASSAASAAPATGSAAATAPVQATSSGTAPAASGAATATVPIEASSSATAQAATGTGTAATETDERNATSAGTAASATGSGAATASLVATSSASATAATGAAAATAPIAASSTATASAATGTGTASAETGERNAISAAVAQPATGAGSATAAIAATSAAAASAASGTGTIAAPIAVTSAVTAAQATGTGTAEALDNSRNATSAATASAATGSGSAVARIAAASAASVAPALAMAAAVALIVATSAGTASAPTGGGSVTAVPMYDNPPPHDETYVLPKPLSTGVRVANRHRIVR